MIRVPFSDVTWLNILALLLQLSPLSPNTLFSGTRSNPSNSRKDGRLNKTKWKKCRSNNLFLPLVSQASELAKPTILALYYRGQHSPNQHYQNQTIFPAFSTVSSVTSLKAHYSNSVILNSLEFLSHTHTNDREHYVTRIEHTTIQFLSII